ncbi:MAG: transglutaminase-like domain-containing protein, partial [Bacteroidota bacterium]|nr:transglutaminase-like domain-containing protein [Bacteroidota bacterium]
MKKIGVFLISMMLFQVVFAQHLISDAPYRQKVHQQFLKRQSEMSYARHKPFSIFKLPLSTEQREAMEFLYAYMPLNDIADYAGSFFLKQVDASLKARQTFSWCKTMPEDIFRHFVLPYRVNNENLDSARTLFFNELRNRVINMTMKDAALEVNHWCHEKVTYRGSDERTSAPLSTVRTSFGRCGEESTFTVTALRSVGIPARQCYTPRWAHCDDNHAWVEVWIDGKWYFMGACEPEADLNMGWFAGPSKRAMMVHTNVFGDYRGKEEVNQKEPWYSKINILSNYAPVKQLFVRVLDSNNKPVKNARVDFGLYNYAEFYSIASKMTTPEGIASLTTGYGDLLCWATDGKKYDYRKVTVEKTDTLTLKLKQTGKKEYTEDFDLLVPIERPVADVDSKNKEINAFRFKQEDSIRTAYMNTFMKPDQAEQLARSLNLNSDDIKLIMGKCYGNYREISEYLRQGSTSENSSLTLPLLSTISEKDLRDTPAAIFLDHILNVTHPKSQASPNYQQFISFILSPRVANEILTPWRSFLKVNMASEFKGMGTIDPLTIKTWILQHIKIKESENYYDVPITPIGVYNLRQADLKSCNIFYVAVCRTFGLASRVEASTGIPQYLKNGNWVDVVFKETGPHVTLRGKLQLESAPANTIKPEYYTHFTLARLQDGKFVTLDFEYSDEMKSLPATLNLLPGYYRMITGNRMNNGNVLARATYFNIIPGTTIKQTVELRPLIMKPEILGS